MILGLTVACVVLGVICLALAVIYFKMRFECEHLEKELSRYSRIADAEKHTAEQRSVAEAAQAAARRAQEATTQLNSQIAAQQATSATHQAYIAGQERQMTAAANMLGAYKSLDDLKKQVAQYNQLLGNFKTAEQLRAHVGEQSAKLEELRGVLGGVSTVQELNARITYQQNYLAELQAKAGQVEEALEMQEFGFYRPRYDFETSSQYQERLDQIRDQQTQMVKKDSAVIWEKKWVVENSEAKGKKMMAEQTKLMLRAFNGECDAAVAKVKYNNATTLETRIDKSYEQINKLGKTNSASITEPFLRLKLQELYLVHEHRRKQEEEREIQRQIREQMREEEKAQREIEAAEKKAEVEEEKTELALERARLAFERATQGQIAATEQTRIQNAALAAQVEKLERELKDAIDRKAKAIARAQLTKSGHVYVLSNIGSFGEDVYKLGLTRRLEPLERIKELGDASVPFEFDVHAIIYCENAPELERKLHLHFHDRRVNLVNLRREYFHVTLEEVMAAVKHHHGEITFVKVPEAAEYRETLAKRKADRVTNATVIDLVKPLGLQNASA